MKKIFVLIIILLLVVGCSKKEEKQVVLECEFPNTTITLTIEDGKIIKYVDKIQGEFSVEDIEILNNSYLANISNNNEALNKMKEVIATNGGDCIRDKE